VAALPCQLLVGWGTGRFASAAGRYWHVSHPRRLAVFFALIVIP